MAASGFTPISLYYSTTASAVPTSGNLANGELGLNINDMKLYAKNSAGTVTLLASSSSTGATVSSVAVSGGTTGLTTSGGPITTSGTITLAGTLATANGGTNLTSFTSGGVVYASSSSALATGSALTFDGTNLSSTGGATFQGGPTGYGGGEIRLGSTTASIQNGISTQASGTPSLIFDHRGNSNAGNFLWRNGTNGASTLMTLGGLGTLSLEGAASTRSMFRVGSANSTLSGWHLGNNSAGSGGIWSTSITPSATNYTLLADGANTTINSTSVTAIATSGTTRFQVGASGQFGIGGATYGTSGQVLTSGGASAAPTWTNAATGTVTSITVAAGTGMSGGGTVTTSGTVTLTNAGVTSVTAGTGISVSASTGSVTITSTASGGTTMLFCAFSSTMGL